MNTALQEAREFAATTIFASGSFLMNLDTGFEIAIHQELPHAPRSPFYLNLRPEGVKNGRMTKAAIAAVALAMYQLGKDRDLFWSERSLCDIPNAGTPFLDAILNHQCAAERMARLQLIKHMVDDTRSFTVAGDVPANIQQVLLIDDLVTSSLTKKLAIQAIEQADGTVTDLLVFLNRSSDAYTDLAQLGVTLHTVWEFDELITWANANGYLTDQQQNAIAAYPDELAAYKSTVNYP